MGVHTTNQNSEYTGGDRPVNNSYWSNVYDPTYTIENENISVACERGSGSIAEDVLREFSFESFVNSAGGNLDGLDIKRMDAITAINLSLLQDAANDGIIREVTINEQGEVAFIGVGQGSGNITDIYYSMSTGNYVEDPKGVMVVGRKPLPYIRTEAMTWTPIWGTGGAKIYAMDDMLSTNCYKANFSRYANIVFRDPQLDSTYNDGIDNLYEITDDNPWDKIIGYVVYREPPEGLVTNDTKIQYGASARIPIRIGTPEGDLNDDINSMPDMGILQTPPYFDDQAENPDCWTNAGVVVNPEAGVRVDLPDELRFQNVRSNAGGNTNSAIIYEDAFQGIREVYLVGREINNIHYAPISPEGFSEEPSLENSRLWISIQNSQVKTFKLSEGKHYAVGYADESTGSISYKQPYIVFAQHKKRGDPFDYGSDTVFYLDPLCNFAYTAKGGGLITAGQTGTIFPTDPGKGVWVNEIWVVADMETPSVSIYDPDGENNRALEIALGLKYYLAPIVMVEEPAPIAYVSAGGSSEIVDQMPIKDNDPTTSEDFEDTRMEEIMDEMSGSGLTMNFSVLDETQCRTLAEAIYNHMNDDAGQITYTCGPNCTPQIGGAGLSGGVVNSIRYSYSDSGSYTVSVTEGPSVVGNLAQIDGGPTMKMSEDLQMQGTVVQCRGDNLHFKVRIDGYGEKWAVNMCHRIIRIGDIVNVTVHNNPVES